MHCQIRKLEEHLRCYQETRGTFTGRLWSKSVMLNDRTQKTASAAPMLCPEYGPNGRILHQWEIWPKTMYTSHDISKSYGPVMTKLGGWVGLVARTSWLDVGGPGPYPAYQCDTQRKLLSLMEVCALLIAVLVFVWLLIVIFLWGSFWCSRKTLKFRKH